MTLIIAFILVIVVAAIAYIDSRLRIRREVLFNELEIAYDKMELYLIKNNSHPNNNVIEFLKSYKFLLVNRGLADIRVFISLLLRSDDKKGKESKEQFEEIKKNVDPGLIEVSRDFIKVYDKLVYNSIFKFSFLVFIANSYFYSLFFKSKYRVRVKITLNKKQANQKSNTQFNLRKAISEAFHSENIIPASHKLCA